jgi:hypothetical protein
VQVPQPNNVAAVLVDGSLWSHAMNGNQPGYRLGVQWLNRGQFEATVLNQAVDVTFYSPTARLIPHGG